MIGAATRRPARCHRPGQQIVQQRTRRERGAGCGERQGPGAGLAATDGGRAASACTTTARGSCSGPTPTPRAEAFCQGTRAHRRGDVRRQRRQSRRAVVRQLVLRPQALAARRPAGRLRDGLALRHQRLRRPHLAARCARRHNRTDGQLLDAPGMEVVVGYGADHNTKVGVSGCVIPYGKGQIVFYCLPDLVTGLKPGNFAISSVVADRLLGNALRTDTASEPTAPTSPRKSPAHEQKNRSFPYQRRKEPQRRPSPWSAPSFSSGAFATG